MKALITLLFCSVILAAKADDQIQIVRYGTNVTERPGPVLLTNIIALTRSCLLPNYFPVPAETWRNTQQQSDSFIQVTFASPSKVTVRIEDIVLENGKFKVKQSSDEIIDQILVTLPDGPGARIFARSGTNFFKFSKADPKLLGMVGSEPVLQMRSKFYKALAEIKRPDK